jgi:uncharacterized protein YndB with AHSA1/START domain
MTSPVDKVSLDSSWDLPHPPATAWRALTEPDLLARWLMATDLGPVVGQPFTFHQDSTPWWDGIVECSVIEVETERLLRYSWRSGSGATGVDTVVTWTLTATHVGGTRLALVQSGFVPGSAGVFEAAKHGWQRMVGDLVALLDGMAPSAS